MPLKLNTEKLKELMQDFHVLTDIRIVIFDEEYREILAYPEALCDFCTLMHRHKGSADRCKSSNQHAFEKSKSSGNLLVYKCHAGLMEAVAPLKDNGIIIGYIMFGQISDEKSRSKANKEIVAACSGYGIGENFFADAVKKIKYKSRAQIYAAAKILEACAYYVLLNELISISPEQLINKINKYIDNHISEQISAETLCLYLKISRTRLYEMVKKYMGMGIGEYIRKKRLDAAKKLLQETAYSVQIISEMTGFSDYTYFSKVFKKQMGLSPRAYKKSLEATYIQ